MMNFKANIQLAVLYVLRCVVFRLCNGRNCSVKQVNEFAVMATPVNDTCKSFSGAPRVPARPPARPSVRPSAPQRNQCSISHFLACLGAQENLYCIHIAHQCCDQLTAVKTGYPLTSIASIAGSGVDPSRSSIFLLVFK